MAYVLTLELEMLLVAAIAIASDTSCFLEIAKKLNCN
jgi:hypothetical protein